MNEQARIGDVENETGSGVSDAVTKSADKIGFGDPVARLLQQIDGIIEQTILLLPQIVVGILIIVLTWLFAKGARTLAKRAARRAHMRPSLANFMQLIGGLVAWIIGLMIAAVVIFPNLTPASMIAGLGIGSVAIGFAFKDIFENFLAGIFILLRREMRIGDFIECESIEGKVEHIAVRETHVRETDGELVIVPNSTLFKNPLKIVTDLDQRRTTIICGVAYDVDVDEAREIIRDAVASCDTVITKGRPLQIFAQEFADSSINFEVTWWTGSKPVDVRTSRDQVVAAVKRGLDDAGLEIPFPYRTLTFKEPLPIAQTASEKEAG